MNLNFIFGNPTFVEGIGDIYPIRMKDHDDFMGSVEHLYYSKLHFKIEEEFHLLDVVLSTFLEYDAIPKFEKLFSLTLRKEVIFVHNEEDYAFMIDDSNSINRYNYDLYRQIVMKQNLLFEPKVYKDPLVQKWAMKVLEARAKNNIKMELEDMISTVSVVTGKHYWDLAEYTIYQLKYEFYRISKLKGYDTSITFRAAGAEAPIDYFAESIDMFKNPYDDVFVDKGKLNKINKIFNEK